VLEEKMSGSKGFYYYVMIATFLKADLLPTDTRKQALTKLDSVKQKVNPDDLKRIKAYVKEHWDIESQLIDTAYAKLAKLTGEQGDVEEVKTQGCMPDCGGGAAAGPFGRGQGGRGRFCPNLYDPVLDDSFIVKSPRAKYIKFDDAMFLRCPRCGGRLFPRHEECPFCPFDTGTLPEGLDTDTIRIPEVPTPVFMGPRRLGMRRRLFGAPSSKLVYQSDDVNVTEQDMKEIERILHNHIPR
jgi:hypothetical protein